MRNRILSPPALLTTFATLTRLVSSTALSDFAPTTTGLKSSCQAVYDTQIAGCTNADFDPKNTCSESCIAGLVQIGNQVNGACKSDSPDPKSLVGLFLSGQGIQVLCRVAVVTTVTGTGSVASVATPSSTSSSSGGSAASSQSSSSPATSSSSSSTSMSFSMTVSNPATAQITTASSQDSTTATTTTTASVNLESLRSGNINSGGGSPIDNIDNSMASDLWANMGLTSLIAASVGGFLMLAG